MNLTLNYFNDPGHGWVAVKRAKLIELGIADRISPYSYQRGATVYLEEDCDASLFLDTLNAAGHTYTLRYKHTDRNSPIRSYERYAV